MSQGRVRHVFPGGNTSLGFFSYYDNIIRQEDAERIFVIKGGPGVGKSTFMKRIGEKMLAMGYDVEYMHCSSDSDSLDGLVIPELKIAFIDGTAPHVVDPKNPGAVDEILNFGEYWDADGIRAHRDEIIGTGREVGYIFGRAYRYLRAAYAIYEGSAAIYREAAKKGAINGLAAELIEELLGNADVGEEGRERKLFASAITPDGFYNYLDSVLTAGRVYELTGGLGTGEDGILTKIKTAALERGYDTGGYYCALNPYKIEHLVIPGLDAAFTTANHYHSAKVKKYKSFDMLDLMDHDVLGRYGDDLHRNQADVDTLLNGALNTVHRAKALHDKLETYYVPHIRFGEIDGLLDRTLERILG